MGRIVDTRDRGPSLPAPPRAYPEMRQVRPSVGPVPASESSGRGSASSRTNVVGEVGEEGRRPAVSPDLEVSVCSSP